MAEPKLIYRRLPGRGSRTLIPPPHVYWLALLVPVLLALRHRITLWLGDDHLLNVTSNGYGEEYKRFYFREIQAILVRRTHEGKALNGVWATLTLMFVVIAALVGWPGGFVFYGVAGIFLACLVINVALGPTCRCHVRTAVQTDELRSLNRLRTTRKALDRVRPLLEAAQGSLSRPDAAPAGPGAVAGVVPSDGPAAAGALAPGAGAAVTPLGGAG